ncbi:MAG: hypothetical protein HUJ67_04240 [Ruminiclostridium sp.]|nr:hypothetical protein [Ruminiclostridium sp.]
MSDDNNFTLGDILWEYADYTPPEPTPSVPLPPEEPPISAPPAEPLPPSVATPPPAPAPAPRTQPKPAPQTEADPYLPANRPVQQAPKVPAAPQQKPETPPAAPQQQDASAQPETAPQQTTPVTQETPAQTVAAPQQEAQSATPEAPPKQTGVPQDDGPDLIAFTPDPHADGNGAGETEATPDGEPGTEQDSGSDTAEPVSDAHEVEHSSGYEDAEQSSDDKESEPVSSDGSVEQGPDAQEAGQTSGDKGPTQARQTQQTRPGGQAQQTPLKGQESHRREKKPRPTPEVPPDAPAAQLALEYGQGLPALKNRCIISGVVTAFLLALSVLESGFGLLAPLTAVFPDVLYLPLGLALFVVVVVLSSAVLKNGLVQLTNKTPNGDTLALLAVIFTLIDGCTLLAIGLRPSTLPFFAPCGLVLTFHLLGMYLTQSGRHLACHTAASIPEPYVVTQDPNILGNQPAFRKWLSVPKGFGSQVRTLSHSEFRFQRLTPVLTGACIVLSLITTVAHHQPQLVFWSLSALFTAASTLGASMVFSLPFKLLSKKLAKLGAALAGWPGAIASKGCKAVAMGDLDIFPPGAVTLMTARPFGSWSMDKVASYTASAIRASSSGLTFLFDRILRAEHGAYLMAEKLILQEGGIVAQLQGQEVLVGNGDFILRQNLSLPQGVRSKDAVFCAIGGEVIGMFVLRYTMHISILPALQALFAHKLHPLMITRDFNLTPQRLRLSGRLPTDQITFPNLARRVALSTPDQFHSDDMVAVLCKEGLPPLSEALIGAKRIHRSGKLAGWFVNVSAFVGVLLTAVLSSAGALSSMCAWNLSLFLLLWFLPVLLISLWTTRY